MRKYYFKDSAGQQQGPLKLDNLKGKGINAETPIWYEGLEKWTTAGQVDELKTLINPPVVAAAAPVVPAPVAEVVQEAPKVVEPAPAATVAAASVTTTAASATSAAASKPQAVAKAATKKGSSAVTYALSLLVIAGVGYFIYQDMEKNKTSSGEIVLTDTASGNTTTTPTTTTEPSVTTTPTDTPADTAATEVTTTTSTEPPVTTPTTTTTTTDPAALKKAEEEKKKQLAAKKAADDKKKQLAADAKKKEDEKKKQLAAQAAREAEMRNNWPRYITIGSLNYKEDDGIKAFPISISNGMTGALDKVTIRVDYVKKEGKVVGTEMLTLNGIAARSSSSVQASGNKKAKKVNVYIVNATSKQLHFCYPVNSGNAADPYYCN